MARRIFLTIFFLIAGIVVGQANWQNFFPAKTKVREKTYYTAFSAPNPVKIHDAFTKNTDACASCHSPHTARGAKLLLEKTVFLTCGHCHDGSLGEIAPDVIHGRVGITQISAGGLFTDFPQNAEKSLSTHDPEGTVLITAAPGNNFNFSPDVEEIPAMTCASCHNPHLRGENFRLLSEDPGKVKLLSSVGRSVPLEKLKKISENEYRFSKPAISYYPYSLYLFVTEDDEVPGVTAKITKIGIRATVYGGKELSRDDYFLDLKNSVVKVYRSFERDLYIFYFPALRIAGETDSEGFTVYLKGFNEFCSTCHAKYFIKAKYTDGITPGHLVGYEFNDVKPKGLVFGKLPSGEDKEVLCLTCHVAHGVNDEWWQEWVEKSGWGSREEVGSPGELAGRSALKRLPNMASCEACHKF
ncbi:hypothetical protein ciss_21590 [Carboxydothermus islandicus]|uniref:Doubled CXXCH motif domain-containing protein n=1 Tax=Carboxydothermus islandicus TaxID=661089 RepID=A0A1L8D4U3_9THEO|nr:cytochrome c3 family protein [Carboxydothermus islandicus]GAV26226.1 hypothetical protein ciss_21590 [Carboxydothermus islandicus]